MPEGGGVIPVFQTMTVANDGEGNCFNACIASVLELPLRDVAPIHPKTPDYWESWETWFAARGLELDYVSASTPPKGWSIARGLGHRIYPDDHKRAGQPIMHATVAFNGEVLHDPFPGGKGLKEIEGYWAILPVEKEAV
jgi:hypothetical protein